MSLEVLAQLQQTLPDVAKRWGRVRGRAFGGATEGASLPPGLKVLDVEFLGPLPVFVPCTLAGPPAFPTGVTLSAGEIITCLSGR